MNLSQEKIEIQYLKGYDVYSFRDMYFVRIVLNGVQQEVGG